MKKTVKQITNSIANRSIPIARRQLSKHPFIKQKLTNVVRAQFSGHLRINVGYQILFNEFFPDGIECVRLEEEMKGFNYTPLISIVIPTYNTDHEFLRQCIESVESQIYKNWELCIVDDASTDEVVRSVIEKYALADPRIKYKFLKDNQHIAGATNIAITMTKGKYVALLDHDDILWPNALFEVIKALNTNQKLDFLYSDEDKITLDRHDHLGPFFKPDWNPDFLHSVNYITHFSVIRRTLLQELGGLRKEYNGAQDWDLFLRVGRATDQIYHIQKIVYSWRIHDLSTAKSTDSKPYVVDAQRSAIKADLKEKGYADASVKQDKNHPGYWNVEYRVKGNPLISIIIPSKDQYKVVKRCIESIYKKTTYKKFEIILVDTGSTNKKVLKLYEQLKAEHQNFLVVDWAEQPFSYARSCNKGAEAAKGDLLVMLNNDTEVITPNWLELMAGDAQRKEIGAVGCLMFFPDGRHIQHAGVGVGLGGVAANSFSMMTLTQPLTQTQHLMLNTKHDMTAVTAACLMIKKDLFKEFKGFDEEFRVTYNDVDLCLKLYSAGYQNIYTPHVRLLHHESISVGLPKDKLKRDNKEFDDAVSLFKSRWAKYVDHDPNINNNLDKDNAFYDITKL
jgi:GT2 family glycosyltransferase